MTIHKCPLCGQNVSERLYNSITGIWKEKEIRLARLKEKQKKLEEREKRLTESFRKRAAQLQRDLSGKTRRDLARQAAAHKAQLTEQRRGLEKRLVQVQQNYQRKLAAEVDVALTEERRKQKELMRQMREELRRTTENAVLRERDRLRSARDKLQRKESKLQERNTKLLVSFQSLRLRSAHQLESAEKRIQALEKQVKERETAQSLGRLQEDEFLARLRKAFPTDRCEKTPGSRCGDILHYVIDGGNEIGLIVYELKTGPTFSKSHIQQALSAKQDRGGDYGILVTEARRPKDPAGIGISKGVIIVHHAAAIVVADILRKQLVTVARLRLGAEEKREAVKAVLAYLQSANFKNAIEAIVQESVDLHEELKREVATHVKGWEQRLTRYRSIVANARSIEGGVAKIGLHGEKKPVEAEAIERIALPRSIG